MKPPATLVVQVGVGHGCWETVKEPLLHPDNSVSFMGTAGRRYQTKPGNWRSTIGDVPPATGSEVIYGVFDPDGARTPAAGTAPTPEPTYCDHGILLYLRCRGCERGTRP